MREKGVKEEGDLHAYVQGKEEGDLYAYKGRE